MRRYLSNRFVLLVYILITVLFISNQSCTSDRVSDTKVFSDNYSHWVEVLSSDEFEGRAPTTPGGEKTKRFIESEYRRIGLRPFNGDSYRQPVPLVEITGSNFSKLLVRESNKDIFSFSYMNDMVVGTALLKEKTELKESEMIFAGYGIVAPEYGWNDYDGIDVKGKTVVVFINDPGYYHGHDSLFNGKAMTYYGRWTYKYEEAARQGASCVLIVHEEGPAGYGWDVVRNSWSGPQYKLGGEKEVLPVDVEGWIQKDVAELLLEKAGVSLQEAKEMASQPDFKPFSMGMRVSVSFEVDYKEAYSHNIIGYVDGLDYPDEAVVYMAHWDHLGKVQTPEGIKIYNGAIDNATGVAAIIAIAEKFSAMKPAPGRSVVFIALTAEESGLLGSLHYAQNPLFPLETTAGGINIDGLNVYGPTHDVSVVGYNSSELQEYLFRHAKAQKRVLIPEKYPERGYFYRSDHFNLVRLGVPMIYANSGEDFIGRDEDYPRIVREDKEARYHSPDDVINEKWDWNGLHQNLWLFFNIGKELAESDDWPGWNENSEFKTIREASEDKRR